MPLYSYKCELCKEEFELLEKLSSVLEPKICKKCGKLSAIRTLSTTNFIFKGNGFYETTYKNKK